MALGLNAGAGFNCAPVRHDLFDRGFEAIAAPRHGLNIDWLPRVIAEGPPELLDVEGQVCFFNKRVGPEPAHQLVLRDQSSVLLEEYEKGVENLWRERHRIGAAQEDTLIEVNREVCELVKTTGGEGHD